MPSGIYKHHKHQGFQKGNKKGIGNKNNLGKHRSEKMRKEMSKAKLNSSKTSRKENHWNWQGGKTKIYKHTDTQSFRYKKWRIKVFTRDNFTCQFCKIKGNQVDGYLIPHHIKG